MVYIERIANIAIIIVVMIFVAAMIPRQFLERGADSAKQSKVSVGQNITASGIPLSRQSDSLVLGISTHCHFCQDSLPFYRNLSYQLQGKLKLIAVLPESPSESESFIKGAGIVGTEVVSKDLSLLGIDATPTVLVVDQKGIVTSIWEGELDTVRQKKLVAELAHRNPHSPDWIR